MNRSPYLQWTEPELSLAAKKITSGRGWLAIGVEVATCFGMVLAVAPKEMIPEHVVGMYADYDLYPPMPTVIDGKPVFPGGRFINGEDASALVDKVEELQQASA